MRNTVFLNCPDDRNKIANDIPFAVADCFKRKIVSWHIYDLLDSPVMLTLVYQTIFCVTI